MRRSGRPWRVRAVGRWPCALALLLVGALAAACGAPAVPRSMAAAPSPTAGMGAVAVSPTAQFTVPQAAARLGFALVAPTQLPTGLQLLNVEAFPDDGAALLYFGRTAGGDAFTVVESRHAFTPADALWPPHALVTTTTQTVGDVTVTRYAAAWESCATVTEYVWRQGDVSIVLTFYTPVAPATLARVITDMLDAAPDALPTPTPTPTLATPQRAPYGDYCDLTAAQATQLAPFPLRLPDPPAPLTFAGAQLLHVPTPDEPSASPPATLVPEAAVSLNEARVTYALATDPDAAPVTLTVSTFTPENYAPPIPHEQTVITIAGIEVERDAYGPPPTAHTPPRPVEYTWYVANMRYVVSAVVSAAPDAALTQANVEQLIAALIGG